MKLGSKILTSLIPVASIGAIVPIVVSCGGSAYEINYGDNINTLDDKAEGYKKVEDVQKAIQNRANKDFGHQIGQSEIETLNNNISTPINLQSFYYDFIASHVFCEDVSKQQFSLLNWKVTDPDESQLGAQIDFSYNGQPYTNVWLSYAHNSSNQITLNVSAQQGGTSIVAIRSYIYWDCTFRAE